MEGLLVDTWGYPVLNTGYAIRANTAEEDTSYDISEISPRFLRCIRTGHLAPTGLQRFGDRECQPKNLGNFNLGGSRGYFNIVPQGHSYPEEALGTYIVDAFH